MTAAPPRCIRGTLARIGAALVTLVLAAACSDDPGVSRITTARFLLSNAERPPAESEPWQAIPLPDPWDGTRRDVFGGGWYRLEADIAPGNAGQGLYLTRSLSTAQLWVNGQLAGQLGDLAGRPPDRWATHHLFPLPRLLLREGRNVFHVRTVVPYDTYGGIGVVLVGDYERLRMQELRDQFTRSVAPAVASLSMMLLGAFILVLWVRRKDEHIYAFFALGTMLWGFHTGLELLPVVPLPPPHYEIWWNVLYVLFVALLCIFSVRFAGGPRPRYERACLAAVALSVPILYTASIWNEHTQVARWVRLAGIVMALWALDVIVRHTMRTREPSGVILLAVASIAAIFGIHDWVAALDASNMTSVDLVPYVALFFAVLMGWIMVDRFVKTLNQYERLNVELEERVAEKSRALEVELEKQDDARREAESANLAKSRFLAAASHDLRQPLHALGLFAEALDAKTHDPASRALMLRINRAIASLESLFSEVLDVSRLDAGAVTARPRAIALQPILDTLTADLVPEALRENLALRIVPTRACVTSDPVLLERILRNLLANAIRYTHEGGVVVGVRRRGARSVAIEVRDSGIGIPDADQARIFEEFYQAGNPERDRRKGLGLGLSIVKRLCELLGHRIELLSKPGRGTIFRIVLERADAPSEEPATEAQDARPSMTGIRVLVLDDDPEVRDGTCALLRSWGCEARDVATQAQALAACRQALPDALIVDYRLGDGTDGIEAARALRAALGAELPVILVSGESAAHELARIQASGLPLLHKPVPPARLRGLLFHLLGAKSA